MFKTLKALRELHGISRIASIGQNSSLLSHLNNDYPGDYQQNFDTHTYSAADWCKSRGELFMSKSCQGSLEDLVKCLRQSDCMKVRTTYDHLRFEAT